MNSHPNATAALFMGAVTIVLVYIAGLLGLSDTPEEVSSAFTTILIGATLFIGRRSVGSD